MGGAAFGAIDFDHYDPAGSPIANVFDISSPDRREHFLLPNILAFVDRTGRFEQEGFVEAKRVREFCQDMAFFPSQIEAALKRAVSSATLRPKPVIQRSTFNSIPNHHGRGVHLSRVAALFLLSRCNDGGHSDC
jgi:hypothetical protein